MLNRLVLADRPIENNSVLGVLRRTRQSYTAKSYRFGSNENALGIETVEDILEAAPFLADPIGIRDHEPVDEKLVAVDSLATHLFYFAHFYKPAIQLGIKQA